MQITKIVNNNIVISEDKNHKEVVLMGKGLGFQKHKGDEIKLSQIEKTYVMKDHGMTQRFQEMLTDIPIERVKICNKIIQYAKDTLQKNINDNNPKCWRITEVISEIIKPTNVMRIIFFMVQITARQMMLRITANM